MLNRIRDCVTEDDYRTAAAVYPDLVTRLTRNLLAHINHMFLWIRSCFFHEIFF